MQECSRAERTTALKILNCLTATVVVYARLVCYFWSNVRSSFYAMSALIGTAGTADQGLLSRF